MTSNRSICHDFFYSDFNKYRCLRNYNIWYDQNVVYSYGTAIGCVVKDKRGNKVFLYSRDSMSNTTGRHISHLWRASPYPRIPVAFDYGSKAATLEAIASNFRYDLRYCADLKMTRVENRRAFIDLFDDAMRFSNEVFTLEGLDEFADLYNTLKDDKKVAEIKARERKANSEKIKQAKAEWKKLLSEHSYLELVKMAFSDWGNEVSRKLRIKLNPQGFYSFVWLDDDVYCTSQGIRIPKALGDIALKRWQDGKLKIGDTLDRYTVLKITDEYVKVGCHIIPTENLKALLA